MRARLIATRRAELDLLEEELVKQLADVRVASVPLDAGENVRALSEYLGHGDPGFTLRTCTHLMPNSQARARRAVDSVFREGGDTDDGPQTAQEEEKAS